MRDRDGLHARLYILDANRDWISVAIAGVMADGGDTSDLVVLVLDTRGDVGGGIARALSARHPKLNVDRHERVVLGKGEIPTAIAIVEVALARALLAESNPTVSKALAVRPPLRRLRVVAVASGGASLAYVAIGRVGKQGFA